MIENDCRVQKTVLRGREIIIGECGRTSSVRQLGAPFECELGTCNRAFKVTSFPAMEFLKPELGERKKPGRPPSARERWTWAIVGLLVIVGLWYGRYRSSHGGTHLIANTSMSLLMILFAAQTLWKEKIRGLSWFWFAMALRHGPAGGNRVGSFRRPHWAALLNIVNRF